MRKLWITIAIILICTVLAGCSGAKGSVVVGAKDYTEQYILGNILAVLIESNTDINVTLKVDLGSDMIFAGIIADTLDIYVDYTGTIYANHLNFYDSHTDFNETASGDAIFEISKSALMENHNILMLDRLGFNNTYALAIREETAAEFNIRTISDLANVSSDLIFGGGNEILNRSDGIPTLKIRYDMGFKSEVVLNGNNRYYAIAEDNVQVIEAFSTDGMLLEYSLVVLEDDKQFFPPYHAVPIIRDEIAQKHPEIVDVINKLVGIMTDEVMRNLNFKVDVLGLSPRDVAEEFLKEMNLIR